MSWSCSRAVARVKVRGVQVHGRPSTEAVAGQRTAINLGGVDVGDVSRGETLLAPDTLSVTRRVDAEIDLLPSAKPLKHGARVRVHNGTAEVLGRVSIAGASVDRDRAGRRARWCALRLEAPAVLTRGDRFIIRAYSPPITIGGGIVLDAGADAARRSHPRKARPALERLRIAGDDGIGALLAMIDGGRPGGHRAVVAGRRAPACAPAQLPSTLQALARAWRRRRRRPTGRRAPPRRRRRIALLALVAASHKANPMSEGLPREEAREKIFARVAPAIFEKVDRRSEGGESAGRHGSAGAADAQGDAWPAPTIASAPRSSRRIAPADSSRRMPPRSRSTREGAAARSSRR